MTPGPAVIGTVCKYSNRFSSTVIDECLVVRVVWRWSSRDENETRAVWPHREEGETRPVSSHSSLDRLAS